jgi:hypothetical protein
VTETGDIIKIAGIPGNVVQRDIMALWGTSKIITYMFTHVTPSEVTFNRWFAPDVVYAFQRMIDERRKGTHVRALKRIVAAMYEHTWLKNTLVNHPDIIDKSQLSKLNCTLLEHQDKFLNLYNIAAPRYGLNGYLVAAGPGTGKTILGLAFGLVLKADVVICVGPKNAVHRVWVDTIKERFKKIPHYWTSLDGVDAPRKADYYIIHYAYLEKMVEFMRHNSFRNVVILLDESHNVNEIDTDRVQAFMELCRVSKAKHVLWESGTPVKALGSEMAPLMRTIDPMFDNDAQKRFSAIYGKSSGRANDILAARMGRMTYKVSSSSVVAGKPIHHRIDIQMPTGKNYTLDAIRTEMRAFIEARVEHYVKNMRMYEKQYEQVLDKFEKTLDSSEKKKMFKTYLSYIREIRRHYDPVALKEQALFCNKYEKDVIMPTLTKEDKDIFKNVRSIVKYYMLKVQGEALGQVLGRKRAQCIVEMLPYVGVEDIIDGAAKKTVVFTSYVKVLDALDAYLKKAGYKPLLVYGETNNELPAIVAKFGKDIDANPLGATYASLSAAVPLVMANQMIMLNWPFRSFEYDQATARCFRLGQDTQVYIADVFLDTGDAPNITTRSRDILDWSRQQVEEIMDFKAPTFAMEEFCEDMERNKYLINLSELEELRMAVERPSYMAW